MAHRHWVVLTWAYRLLVIWTLYQKFIDISSSILHLDNCSQDSWPLIGGPHQLSLVEKGFSQNDMTESFLCRQRLSWKDYLQISCIWIFWGGVSLMRSLIARRDFRLFQLRGYQIADLALTEVYWHSLIFFGIFRGHLHWLLAGTFLPPAKSKLNFKVFQT